MASVNQQSLREEFEALKGRFAQLSADGKITAESRTVCDALLMLLQVLMAVFMERNTPRNSANSSKPSSQTPKDETALTRAGSHGKGQAYHERRSANTRTVENVQVSKVGFCEECGEDLREVPGQGQERRTQIDIVFEKVVTHVDAEIRACPNCAAQARGPFPEGFSGPLQYGAGIKAYVLNLCIAQIISLKRVQQSIRTLIGQVISEATILKHVLVLHQALEQWEKTAIGELLKLPAIHLDETSLRVDKKNHWIHVCSGGAITLKFVHEKRGQEAMAAIGVIPRYGGVIIHDCWASYLAYEHCDHGLCGAYLLREYAQLQKHYRNILTRGAQDLPPIPPRQNGKRGRIAKSDAHNLWERLKEHERAERDLRMSKVKQKVSGCFRTTQYAQAYCRICSYLQTMANRGYNPLVAIQLALSGQLYAHTGE